MSEQVLSGQRRYTAASATPLGDVLCSWDTEDGRPHVVLVQLWADVPTNGTAASQLPTQADLKKVFVLVSTDGNNNDATFLGVPTLGATRLLYAKSVRVQSSATGAPSVGVSVAASLIVDAPSLGERQPILMPIDFSALAVGVSIPRFATQWQALDATGGAAVQFQDFRSNALLTVPWPVDSDWHPIPYGAAGYSIVAGGAQYDGEGAICFR